MTKKEEASVLAEDIFPCSAFAIIYPWSLSLLGSIQVTNGPSPLIDPWHQLYLLSKDETLAVHFDSLRAMLRKIP